LTIIILLFCYVFRFRDSNGGWEGELVYTIEAFMDTRGLAAPIYPDSSEPDNFGAGNVNIYTDTMLWELDAIGASALIGLVQGTCVRTDLNGVNSVEYAGRGWCSLTFEALVGTELGQEVVASFSAEGSVLNHNNTNFENSVLTITGGLGQFAGITGDIYLDTAFLNTDVSPPKAVYDANIDFLNSPDGYILFGFLYSDVRIDMLEQGGDDIVADELLGDDIFGTDNPSSTADPSASEFPSETLDPSAQDDVLCPEQTEDNFCDCASDCINFPDTRCVCAAAQLCCQEFGFA
jgi:hypothetical protein